MTNAGKKDVLLVGSIGLANAEEVFQTVGSILGERVLRVPDGETGNARSVWIQCQMPFFFGNSQFEMVEPDPKNPEQWRPARMPSGGLYSFTQAGRYQGRARLRPGVASSDVRFDNLGYADWAEESYGVFSRVRAAGGLPASTRFQVCIPSPRVTGFAFTTPEDGPKIQPAYEAALAREIQRMAATIPNQDLSVQWDCTEPGAYEVADTTARRSTRDYLTRLGTYVPEPVELGYHFCYGDFEHRHGRQPVDASAMVEMANAISSGLHRSIGWMHMPVPRDRSDDAYFAPMKDLSLRTETRLYLGLVHYTDGVEGTLERMATANRVVGDYGIGTECGFGRRPNSQDIRALMRIHAQLADL